MKLNFLCLTDRQLEWLMLFLDGKTNKETTEIMGVSRERGRMFHARVYLKLSKLYTGIIKEEK